MRFPLLSSGTATLLCAAALSAITALGQSLSIKRADTNYWLEASAPANNSYTLQASQNLHLWLDIQDSVPDRYSYPLDNTGVSKLRYFRLIPSPPAAPPIRVMLIGDSMVSDCCGWGRGIYGYFNPNATVINYAQPWT